jgi:hypothetical protein
MKFSLKSFRLNNSNLFVTTACILFMWCRSIPGYGIGYKTEDLEPLFTGLGFIAVMLTLNHEREQGLNSERENQQQNLDAAKRHHEQLANLQAQIAATLSIAQLTAIPAAMEHAREELKKFNLSGVSLGSGSGAMAMKRKQKIELQLQTYERMLERAIERTNGL